MKIKALAAGALAIAALSSCSEKKQETTDYTLNVEIEDAGANGTMAYLTDFDSGNVMDSVIITDGKAVFTGSILEPTVVRLSVNGNRGAMLILEGGETTYKNGQAISTLNDKYQAFVKGYSNRRDSLYALIDSTMTESEQEAFYRLSQLHLDSVVSETMVANIYNPIGYMILLQKAFDMEADKFQKILKDYPHLTKFQRIDKIKKSFDAREATSAGKPYTDFEIEYNGATTKLSDYVKPGQYTLVDFWASWCGPCRREMPNLVEAYAKYKGKNFEIVGVSLDQDGAAWKEAIKKMDMTWPQMSDLKFWQCEGAQLYAVNSIPHTVLIDGSGKIIARGLHGEELQAKIAEVVK